MFDSQTKRNKSGQALEGAVAVGGLGAIGAGLYSLGIPKDSILKYETALKTDKFVLMPTAPRMR